jgi:hypothetical protein
MKKTLFAFVVGLAGLLVASGAHAFTVAKLTKRQEKLARAVIKSDLPKNAKILSVKFGFGPTPPGFIGSGFEHALVKVKEGSKTKTIKFTVSPNWQGGVNVNR